MMKSMRRICLMVFLVVLMAGAGMAVGTDSSNRYVVVFAGNSVPKDAAQLVRGAGGELVKTFNKVGVGIATSSLPDFDIALRRLRGVHSAGPARFHEMPIVQETAIEDGPDPGVDTYYELYQWDIRRVKADLAWAINSGSHDTVVAILDTGIAWNHPDLAPNVVHTACYSVLSTPCSPYPSLSYHGTHVAGTVAAAFGGGSAVGVGPNLGLASYNVFELYGGSAVAFDEALWAALLDVAERGYDVVNMSLGGYIVRSDSPADVAAWVAWNRVADYVTRRGVLIVASSGNEAANLNGPVDHIPSDVTGIISVGATGIRPNPIYPQAGAFDVLADYSNYGASTTLVAPGGDTGPEGTPLPFPGAYYLIFSTFVYLNPACAATASCPLGYAWLGGTSMAAPHVSGVAGLIKDKNPNLSPQQITAILKQTAESLGNRIVFGHGMVDALKALQKR